METYSRLTQDYLKEIQNTDASKTAIKLLGQALEGHVLDQNEFSLVRDFLITTVLIENGSRPGTLETAKVSRFKMAAYVADDKTYTILVDEHKTTRHQGPAELTINERNFNYLKIYVNYIRPAFVASEDTLFINTSSHRKRNNWLTSSRVL